MKHTGNAVLPRTVMEITEQYVVRMPDPPYVRMPQWRCRSCGATWLKYRQHHPGNTCVVAQQICAELST